MLGRAVIGGVLLVGVRLLTRISDLITMLVLARILEPASFGLVAVCASIVMVIETALELPLHNVLLRQPVITKGLCDTAFTLSLARGLVIGVVMVAISIPFAQFYHNDRYRALVCVIALAPIFRGMVSPAMARSQQQLSFWRDFAIEVIGKAAAAIIAIAVALATHSYWAIAAATVSCPIIMVAVSYVLAPYRPGFSLAHVQEFAEFLGWNTPAQIISAINWQLERLLLGRLQSPAQLGLFSTANEVAGMPYMVLFRPLLRPMYAAFVHAEGDRRQMRKTYQQTSAALLAIGLPLLVGESLVAEPLVRLILGGKWLGAVPLAHMLALSFIPAIYAGAASPLFMAVGDTKLLFKRNLLEFAVKVPCLVYGAVQFGFVGVIVARVISETTAALFCLATVRRLIHIPMLRQLFAGWRSVGATAVMAGAVHAADILIVRPRGIDLPVAQLAILTPVGALTYVTGHIGLWLLVGRPNGVERVLLQRMRGFVATRRRGAEPASPAPAPTPAFAAAAAELINTAAEPLFEYAGADPFTTLAASRTVYDQDTLLQNLSRVRSSRIEARDRFKRWLDE